MILGLAPTFLYIAHLFAFCLKWMFENNSGELGIFFDCVDLTWNPDFVLLAVCFF